MLKYKNYSVILILLLLPTIAFSQAIKFNYIGYTQFESINGSRNLFYGFGYEQNVGSRISLSLEYNRGYKFSDPVSNEFNYSNGTEGFNMYYSLELPWYEVSYTSKYFFEDNDDISWYVSMGIAYRSVTYEMDIQNLNYDPSFANEAMEIQQGSKNESITMVPISFKAGRRGSIDGWYSDMNLGFSFIPGASSNGSGNKTIDKYLPTSSFNNICITLGVSFGIGWAK